ncbi:GTP-binding protein 10 [Nymphon striatum]|nr:GTP-binding protein 10 [Nymphon striatum]
MVRLTRILLTGFKPRQRYNFLDSARICVKPGAGGCGLPQSGGIGGKGSDIYIVAKKRMDFKQFIDTNPTKRFNGKNGENSWRHCLCAPPAGAINIAVPEGVTVMSDTGKVLGDLYKSGDKVLVAEGGEGGNSFNNFLGQKGNSVMIRLDLKLIADVGFVGFPNAGKSTLLRALSKAKPKVANYPFTTLRPELGIAVYEDLRQISMADLPGIIEGSHLNHGLGHRFLKHIERTNFLFVVVDLHGFHLGPKYPKRNAFQSVVLLNKELELYKENLVDKPAVLVLNKVDQKNSEAKLNEFKIQWENYEESIQSIEEEWRPKQKFEFDDIFPTSAMTGHGANHIKNRLRQLIDFHAELKKKEEINDVQKSILS